MFTKSFNRYQFTSEGLIKAKAAGPQQCHYRVRQRARPSWEDGAQLFLVSNKERM
jgi:hypothetical protein